MNPESFYKPGRLGLSYELFPPKTPRGDELLLEQMRQLLQFAPDFVTCTYGAGGSTQGKTLEVLEAVRRLASLPVASHLTVVGRTQDEIRQYLARALDQGVEMIVALRGDPPAGETGFRPAPGGLRYANELVALIRREFPDFGVLVAGYPETHREAPGPDADLANLKRKVDAGADAVVTQLFYNNADYFRFVDRCRAAGIRVPIVPGVLPVTSLQQIQRITSLCGATLPEPLTSRLAERDDPQWQFEAGVEWATRQCEELVAGGVPGLHFYVLNQSPATLQILGNLNAADLRGN